ncbi:MAG: sodium:proton antiporter [Actinomycetota bacterium]|nr:sodium:proton antiporter [Actinomycetota bacterium]
MREILPLWSAAPFAGMLLCVAALPLAAPRFWHNHFAKVAAFWALLALIPMLALFGKAAYYEFMRTILKSYIPFIILLGSIYFISGGILITGTPKATPAINTAMLLAGTALASVMGTIGAAMLIVRPLVRANKHRKHGALAMIFFIFLAANVGGAVTPLGDPPLFLGFLAGVPFFWTLKVLPQMAFATAALLLVFFLLDWRNHKNELPVSGGPVTRDTLPIRIKGAYNLIFILGIMGAVLLSGSLNIGSVNVIGIPVTGEALLRDGLILVMLALSAFFTPVSIRDENEFTWYPLKEVAVLFAAIFITMAPCLDILSAGPKGHLGFIMAGLNGPRHYFWAVGILSSLLDNAPAYLAFLHSALGVFYPGQSGASAVSMLIRGHPAYLKAISAGSVFFGAFTYIGNAPNFLVRSISEEAGIDMPGFFGYLFKYSLPVLVPLYLIITFVFF